MPPVGFCDGLGPVHTNPVWPSFHTETVFFEHRKWNFCKRSPEWTAKAEPLKSLT